MKNLMMVMTGLWWVLSAQAVMAVIGVNPSGVNVRATGTSTVFLTFQQLNPGQTAAEGFWCGEVTTTGVSNVNPCVPGTLFGFLPTRSDLSRVSGTGGARNLTDIMTIPASVSRRAYQSAQDSDNGNFYYVRRFTGNGVDQYVTVTCRMAGGGARSPLALTQVNLSFDSAPVDRPVFVLPQQRTPPSVVAEVFYNGGGRLKGRWEVVMPGEEDPSAFDLLTEATLPVELRGQQRLYTVVDRFDLFLPPTGKALIPGPDPEKIPNDVKGLYKLILRIEATQDKEGNSNTLNGIAYTGGVAGFPMPVLRYAVGEDLSEAAIADFAVTELEVVAPKGEVNWVAGQPLFEWRGSDRGELYLLEVKNQDGLVLEALMKVGQTSYSPPPWLQNSSGLPLVWRVSILNADKKVIERSGWQRFLIR